MSRFYMHVYKRSYLAIYYIYSSWIFIFLLVKQKNIG